MRLVSSHTFCRSTKGICTPYHLPPPRTLAAGTFYYCCERSSQCRGPAPYTCDNETRLISLVAGLVVSLVSCIVGGIWYCKRKQLLCFKTNITASGGALPTANTVMYVEQPLAVAHVQYAAYAQAGAPPGVAPPPQLYGGSAYPGAPAPPGAPVWK